MAGYHRQVAMRLLVPRTVPRVRVACWGRRIVWLSRTIGQEE